jgi:hypothetical protein
MFLHLPQPSGVSNAVIESGTVNIHLSIGCRMMGTLLMHLTHLSFVLVLMLLTLTSLWRLNCTVQYQLRRFPLSQPHPSRY